MIEFTNDFNFLQPPLKLLSLLRALFNDIIKFTTHHFYYIEMLEITESTQNFFFLQSLPKLLLYIVKIIKLLDSVERDNNQYTIYHLYYKDILIMNPIQILAYVAKPGIVIKKKKPLKFYLYLFHHFQFLYLLFCLTLPKIHSRIFEYFLLSKYMTIFQ